MNRRTALLAVAVAGASAAFAAPPASALTFWAVGDGGVAGPEDDRVAARIEREGIHRLLYLGDVYDRGTAAEYRYRYHPSFGRFKRITHPTPGNHEWGNRSLGYDPYWGSRAPRTGGGHWYSLDLHGWHVVSLNSEEAGRPEQAEWLRRDLAAHSGSCTLAFLHRPRYNAGEHAEARETEPLWSALSGHAVAVLGGHDHNYQRFRRNRGLVQFVVGTGGRHLYDVNEGDDRLAASRDRAHGALRLRLWSGRLDFAFVATPGARLDGGSLGCTPHDPERAARVRITSPRSGAVYSHGPRAVRGWARNAARPVRIRLRRVRRGRCRAFDGFRFRRSCRRAPAIAASGRRPFTLAFPGGRRLRRGAYRATALVRGGDGGVAIHSVRFRVR